MSLALYFTQTEHEPQVWGTPQAPPPGVTIVVPCKGRLAHLRESLPRLLAQETRRDTWILVVDYGDPDRCFDWVAAQRHPRLGALRVRDGVAEFNLSRARNCGACAAAHELIAFADADALFAAEWLEAAVAPLVAGAAVATIPSYPDPEPGVLPACGIAVVTRAVFHQVRGFDESFRGWGHEDKDFMDRVRGLGAIARFDARLVTLIPHEPALRVAHYADKQHRRSNEENKARAARRSGPVNPLGYGGGLTELFRCS